jgi:hypothetical protein
VAWTVRCVEQGESHWVWPMYPDKESPPAAENTLDPESRSGLATALYVRVYPDRRQGLLPSPVICHPALLALLVLISVHNLPFSLRL